MAGAPVSPVKTPAQEEQLLRMRYRKAMARKKRKERDAAGEIKELNITAMMDMMTILLVFLLKSFASSSASVTASEDVRPPISTTRATPRDTVAVTITPKNILVGDKEVVRLVNGQVPADQLQGRLVLGLDAQLKKEVEKLKYIADRNPAAPFSRELSIIGDKKVPYDMLLTILYTAGQNELENYRFVVLMKEGAE
ncbi:MULTISPECIES: ExbD/TolR family protein [Stigmatella]|uniref:Biopolymer transport protein ExbD n=2 Tax=Stigmatella TaxID=40 RepID=A0A1H8D4T3_STIAU|nr:MULTISPECIES: biopolymer transporter ExbD [Stigmatella]SEN02182.1 Biopolymer transport protein ExbD [Stigmatella aurantiaca]SEU33260.1 Biopolymer transport protein ExbD [Stigmatella erecta]